MEKKMTKEDYLRKKGLLPKEPMGTIYTFYSDREGVKEIKEQLIWEVKQNTRRSSDGVNWVDGNTYKMKESPYEVTIFDDESVGEFKGLACVIGGDPWFNGTFGSLDKKALIEARNKEEERINREYLNKI